ncbi:NASP-related protein sim3 [Ananas comosus]|uniref:NASP-related protein sim3 n=1 Tax=Ananas comosus TaxID=4615 RepID=A0A6P5FKI5_ANACO|nr:NASP-related protein sim3 [Ananas comosus]
MSPATEEDETLASDPISSSEPDKALAPEEAAGAQNPRGNGDSSSAGPSGGEEEGSEQTLARADELFEKGSRAIEDGEFLDAVDYLSRALEIRVAHYGDLAPECASAYYKYGCALLCKAQEESDPLVVPKNITNPENAKSSTNMDASGSSNASAGDAKEDVENMEGEGGGSGDDESEGDDGEAAEADEDESDLDLSWKLLDIARAIVEKSPEDTMEKVNIWAALGEVSMEREDIEASLNDYKKALSILECLVEPDHRRIVELNFRICLVLELDLKIGEAIPYCRKAISLCKSRLQRLKEDATKADATSSSNTSGDLPPVEKGSGRKSSLEDEIELLSGFLSELEKKLEDLEQTTTNPRSVVSEVMQMLASKPSGEKNPPSTSSAGVRSASLTSSQVGVVSNGFDSPTVSTAATDGSAVTHLGVVGRGIKRAVVKPISAEPPSKKPAMATDSVAEKTGDAGASEAVGSASASQDAEPLLK